MPEDIDFENWIQQWDDMFSETGADKVPSLFDPLDVHLPGNEHLRKALTEKGLDSNKCKYCGHDGCILPWDLRPNLCKEYRCIEWKNEGLIIL